MSTASNANAHSDDVVVSAPTPVLPAQRDVPRATDIPNNVYPLRESDRAYIPMQVSQSALPAQRTAPGTSRWLDEWPLLAVVAAVLLSLVVVVAGDFLLGVAAFVASLVLAFVLRLVLPDSRAGMLKARSRGVDLVVLGGFAVLLVFVAVTLPPF